jgi:3-oxoacyl-[acyl-carrier protein] reductase
MNLGLRGKVAIVTASSKGIGQAVAEALISEGAKVVICSRSKDELIKTASEIKSKYGIEPVWSVCDLNKTKDIETTVDAARLEFGKIDILVNNCGGPTAGLFSEISEVQWQEAFEQVLMSAVRFSRLVLPDMLAKEWGRIINITSVSVKQPIENLMLSNSLRTGLVGFAKSLSNEVAKFNVTVNNVAPGFTLTHRLYDLAVHKAKQVNKSHEEIISDMSKEVPMNRLGLPEEIASAVVFLASQKASYITGNTIHVDGGYIKGIF